MGLLDTDEYEWVVDFLRVARDWKVPPLTVLAGRPPVWRHEDTLLGVALTGYERVCLDSNGEPRRRTENEDFADAYEVDGTVTNYVEQAVGKWRDEQDVVEPGVRPNLVFQPTIRPDER